MEKASNQYHTKRNKIDKKLCLKVLWWIILLFLGFIGNDVYNTITAKSSLDIIMPVTYNEKGEFEINLINNGGTNLNINKVKIHSCYMDEGKWIYRYPDDIPHGEKVKINFFEEKTLNRSSLIDCRNNPLKDWEKRRMDIIVCKDLVSGEVYVPNKNNSFDMCGFCHWNISVITNKGEFNFYEKMFLPVNFAFEIIPQEENEFFDITSPNVVCSDNFKVTYFGTRELEIEGEYD